MADHNRLSSSNQGATMQIMKRTTAIFNANFFTLIILSLLLFSFRTFIENGTRKLTRDASLHSFFSCLDVADRSYRRQHPRCPHPDREDPFTGKNNAGSSDSFSLVSLPSNGSSVILQNIDPNLGLSSDNGVKLPEIIGYRIEFDAGKNDLVFEEDEIMLRRAKKEMRKRMCFRSRIWICRLLLPVSCLAIIF